MQNPMPIEELKGYIEIFLKSQNDDPYHRNLSWDHCYKAFCNISKVFDKDYLALQLAFYLASWGMYRGSSGLLWKDYKIHVDAIDIIEKYSWLRGNSYQKDGYVAGVLELVKDLNGYYEKITYEKITYEKETHEKKISLKSITPTSTLISKIILGTLGCLPAFDQFFCLGFLGNPNMQLTEKNIERIRKYGIDNQMSIQKYADKYPIMKVIDMGFWEYGFEKQAHDAKNATINEA